MDWEDPDGHNDKHFDLETNKLEYLLNYYKVIFNILSINSKQTKEIGGFITFTFEAINLTIGLDRNIFSDYKSQKLKDIKPTRLLDFKQFASIEDQEFYSGDDGVIVGVGKNWRELIGTNKKFNE